jgi:exonuclease III
MKIATFNINVNKRLPNLIAWLRTAGPDVVCLQELKSTDADFPVTAIRRAGYEAVWCGQKSLNGVCKPTENVGRGGHWQRECDWDPTPSNTFCVVRLVEPDI